MKPEIEDRRVLRTRLSLQDALVELMAEQGYENTTVQNIIDRANIGRSTFYAHYRDKEDLLLSRMDEIIHSLTPGLEREEGVEYGMGVDRIMSIEPLLRHATEEYRLHKAIVGGRGIDVMVRRIINHLSRHIQEILEARLPAGRTPSVPLDLLAHHLAGVVMTLLRWWVDNKKPYSPEQMDDMFQDMVMPGVNAILNRAN